MPYTSSKIGCSTRSAPLPREQQDRRRRATEPHARLPCCYDNAMNAPPRPPASNETIALAPSPRQSDEHTAIYRLQNRAVTVKNTLNG
jgi:hypothetical protein